MFKLFIEYHLVKDYENRTTDYIDILEVNTKNESQMSKGGMSEEEEDDLQSQIEQKLEEIEDYEKEFRIR